MKSSLFRRYFYFIVAVFINAMGITLITKALLGTSPISSIPYVASLFSKGTLGQYTIILNVGMAILELPMISRKEFRERWLDWFLQIPTGFFLGLFIDLTMWIFSWVVPTMYAENIICLLIGCSILSFGISMEVQADVAMMAGEYFVRTISKRFGKEFGNVKVCFDTSLAVIACIMSLCFCGHIEGVREGTVIAAIIVGPMTRFFRRVIKPADRFLYPDGKGIAANVSAVSTGDYPVVITISREYGSGGHQLARMISEKLGIKAYDKELIEMAARESGMSEEYVRKNEQSEPQTLLHMIMADYESPVEKSLSPQDILFVTQSKIIRKLAHEKSCIILGRCADYVLEDWPKDKIIRVFCYTDHEHAVKLAVAEYGLTENDAEKEIARINPLRISHYEHYTGMKWGDPHNYDITVNTGTMGLNASADIIAQAYKNKQEKH